MSTATDTYPGLKGTDRVREECGSCGGTGIYTGPSNAAWQRTVNGPTEKWCFGCMGAGFHSVLVSSARARARRRQAAAAKFEAQQAEWDAQRPVREWLEAEQQWRDDVTAWLAEEARVAALVKGFVGEPGDVLRNLTGTVVAHHAFEVASFRGYGTDLKVLVVIELEAGQHIKTFSTSQSVFGLAKGDRVRIVRATVAKHDHRDGQDQTVVTRIKLETEN